MPLPPSPSTPHTQNPRLCPAFFKPPKYLSDPFFIHTQSCLLVWATMISPDHCPGRPAAALGLSSVEQPGRSFQTTHRTNEGLVCRPEKSKSLLLKKQIDQSFSKEFDSALLKKQTASPGPGKMVLVVRKFNLQNGFTQNLLAEKIFVELN